MNEKGRQTKLLAAVAVFAMVVCALVAVMPSTDAASSATQQEGSIVSVAVGDTTTYYDSYSEAVTAVNQLTGTDAVTVTILGNFEVSLAGANSQAAALWFTYTGGAIIINGGGNTISVSDTSVQSNKNIIGFGSGVSAIVNDLVVDGEKFSYHGFNVYGATSLELNDVTSKNNSASGFTLNGSTVEMNNVIASGNGWGDVNIDQGTGLSTTPSVTISGADTSFGSPTQVWTELTTDSIVTFDTTAGTYVEYDWQKTSKISSGYGSIWFKDGTISMNYTVSAEDSLQIPADKTLNIADGVTFAVATDGKFTNNGIIYNEGTIPKTIDGTGVVIDATGTSAITEVAGNGVSNDTIQSIFEAGADEITVTGTAYITEAFDGTIVIDANGGIANTTQESPVVIGENSVLIIENCNGGDFYLSNGTSNENLVQLSGFHGEGMTITYGSITINGKNLSGTITVTGTSPVLNLSGATATGIDQGAALTINAVGGSTINIDKNMTVDGDVAITRGSGEGNVNVNLPSGVTATINGDLSLGEMVRMDSNGTLAGTGSITVNTGATLLYSVNNGVQIINNGGSVQIDDGRALGNTINENTTVSEYSYLTDDLVIPEGITLTVTGTGTLDLMSFNITVNGNLVIQRNGTVTSQNDNSAIRISATGSIQNSGIIGDNRLITVENATNPDQYVKLKGVSGVNISLVRETGGQDRNMVVSGDVRRIAGIVGQTLEVGDVTIDADMSIGSNVTFNVKGDVVVARNVAFTNNGTMNIGSGATFTLSNGASAVISGSTEGVIGANVGYVDPDNGNKLIDETVFSSIKFAGNERGVTLSVGRVSVPQTDGTSLMDQRLYINGSLSRVSTTNSTTASITVVGQVYVSDSLTVTQYVSVDMTADGAVFNIASAGTIIVEDSNGSTIKYIGAHYSVETTVDGVNAVTNYYTTFDNAYSAIATADEGTIYVSGKYTINGTYTIGPDQYIRVEADAGLTVASSAVVEVDEEGTIESDVFDKITGKVTVYAGVGYVPDSQTTYEVLSVNRETGDRTYSGFAIALSEANPGDTITIVAEATYNGNMVIPDQITVQVSDDVVLHVTGNATV